MAAQLRSSTQKSERLQKMVHTQSLQLIRVDGNPSRTTCEHGWGSLHRTFQPQRLSMYGSLAAGVHMDAGAFQVMGSPVNSCHEHPSMAKCDGWAI